jgi:hypothetical protein
VLAFPASAVVRTYTRAFSPDELMVSRGANDEDLIATVQANFPLTTMVGGGDAMHIAVRATPGWAAQFTRLED